MADRIEVYQDKGGEFRWHLKAGNGEVVSDSAEGYTRVADAYRAAVRVHPDVPIYRLTDDAYAPSEIELIGDE